MNIIFNKFIIVRDGFGGIKMFIGRCTFHRELAERNNIPVSDVISGGQWDAIRDPNNINIWESLEFFGDSDQFGRFSHGDVHECIATGELWERNKRRLRQTIKTYKITERKNEY